MRCSITPISPELEYGSKTRNRKLETRDRAARPRFDPPAPGVVTRAGVLALSRRVVRDGRVPRVPETRLPAAVLRLARRGQPEGLLESHGRFARIGGPER